MPPLSPRGLLANAVLCLWLSSLARPAAAFSPQGHEVIEARAYLKLLDADDVRGFGTPMAKLVRDKTSGVDVLRALMKAGLLAGPDCAEPGPCKSGNNDLGQYPQLLTGTVDLILPRQLSSVGQCFHFMANGSDTDAIDGTTHTHKAASRQAYDRCLAHIERLLRDSLEDPRGERARYRGVYAILHAITDSYSRAHTSRAGVDFDGDVQYLKPWRTLLWWQYLMFDTVQQLFWGDRYHGGLFEPRDDEFLNHGRFITAREAGRGDNDEPVRCSEYVGYAPYFVPAPCLSQQGKRSVLAVIDFLLLIYAVHKRPLDEPQAWGKYVASYFGRPGGAISAAKEIDPRAYKLGFGVGSLLETPRMILGLSSAPLLTPPPITWTVTLAATLDSQEAEPERQWRVGGLLRASGSLHLGSSFSIGMAPLAVTVREGYRDLSGIFGRLEWQAPGRELTVAVNGPEWSWITSEIPHRSYFEVWLEYGLPFKARPSIPNLPDVEAWAPDPVGPPTKAPHWSHLLLLASTVTGRPQDRIFELRFGFEHWNDTDDAGRPTPFIWGLRWDLLLRSLNPETRAMLGAEVAPIVRWRPVEYFFLGLDGALEGGVNRDGENFFQVGGALHLGFIVSRRVQLRARSPLLLRWPEGWHWGGEIGALEFGVYL